MKQELYRQLAVRVDARARCIREVNTLWEEKHQERLEELVQEYMPSGSGFDSGTTLDLLLSTGGKLVFHTSFHHMDENGMYDGWTDHTVVVQSSLMFGFFLTISGRNRNDIKEYIEQLFRSALMEMVE